MSTEDPVVPEFRALDEALQVTLRALPSEPGPAVLFSGGVDSGLLAWELRSRPGLVLSTFGLPGAPDPMAARRAASLLGLPWMGSVVTPEQVLNMRDRVRGWAGPLSPQGESIETGFALAMETAPSKTVICGQGADELFFGYAHYQRLELGAAASRSEGDLAQLREIAWPRAQRIAERIDRKVYAPFLDPKFVAAVTAMPASVRFRAGAPKWLLRAWAVHRGLSPEIAHRPKKALQYGSGVDRLLKRGNSRP